VDIIFFPFFYSSETKLRLCALIFKQLTDLYNNFSALVTYVINVIFLKNFDGFKRPLISKTKAGSVLQLLPLAYFFLLTQLTTSGHICLAGQYLN